MKTYVLYHANCPDGFCAAWVARGALPSETEFIPVNYSEPPPEVAFDRDAELFILDFSYSRDIMFQLAALRHQRMVVLDHHKTAREALDGLEIELASNNCGDALSVTFDMDKSGARLAWEHFRGATPAPWLVDYTEDRDLWRFKLPHSEAVSAFLRSHPFDFGLWDGFAETKPGSMLWVDYINQGLAILRYQKQVVRQAVENAREVELGGHTVLAVNTTVCFSEVAGELAKGRPFGAAFFIRPDGKKQWSLRSTPEGVDVAEVARRHGGGGHRNAAGFEE